MTHQMAHRGPAPTPIANQQLRVEDLPELTGFSVGELAEMVRPGGVAAEADNAALVTFCLTAKARGLDPRKRQCYYIKRGGHWTFQTAIDGFSAIAARTGRDGGVDEPRYRGHLSIDVNGQRLDVPEEAAVTIWKLVGPTYLPRPFTGVAAWTEFSPADMSGAGAAMWRKYPRRMLSKCATAQALRLAFPEELGDVELVDDDPDSRNVIDVQERRPPPVSSSAGRRLNPPPQPERPKRTYADIFDTDEVEKARIDEQTAQAHAAADRARAAAATRDEDLDALEHQRQQRMEGVT
jgi:RecT family